MKKWIALGLTLVVAAAVLVRFVGPLTRGRPSTQRAAERPAAERADAPALEEVAAPEPPAPSEEPSPAGAVVSTREGLALRPLSGTVPGTAQGSEARLTWTPLLPEFEYAVHLDAVDYGRVAAVSVATTCGADGAFTFPSVPPGAADGESVVWVTQPGREAFAVQLAPAEAAWRWPEPPALEAREPVRVRVHRAGEPVAGATVRHNLAFRASSRDQQDRRQRRVFLREERTDAEGVAWIVPGRGDNALLARDGGERSFLWTGEPDEDIELELLPTIEVVGRVLVDDPSLAFDEVLYVVGTFSAEDQSDFTWTGSAKNVHADGTFGPDDWPRGAGRQLQVNVMGGELVPARAVVPNPAPGGRVEVVVTTQRGHPFEVAVATPEGLPIADVGLFPQCWNGSEWLAVGNVRTGEDGRAVIHAPTGQLSLQVEKEGFTSESFHDGRTLVPQGAPPLHVVMRTAGVVTGWVRSGSEPVTSFSVFVFNDDLSYNMDISFEDEEGAFRLADLPKGERLSLFAYSDALPQSDTEAFVLGEEALELELELPRSHRASGRVIDSVTFEPIPTATIQHLTSGRGGLAGWRGAVMPVQPDGRFELDGFHPGRGGFACVAEGYEPLYYLTREDESEVIDVGLLALNPTAVLDVRVRDAGVTDYSGYQAWSTWNDTDPLPIGSDGTLALPTRSGPFRLNVARPDGAETWVIGRISAGERKPVEVDFSRGIELWVTLAEPPSGVESWSLVAFSGSRDSDHRAKSRWSAEHEAFVLSPLSSGPAVLELRDTEGKLVTQRSVELSDEPRQQIRLSVGGERRRLRLVRPGGEPWAMQGVTVSLDDASGWSSVLSTDGAGEFEIGPLDATRVVLSAKLGNESIAYGLGVELEPDPADTTVVEIDIGPRALLLLREEGRALGGIGMLFMHERSPRGVFFTYISDEEGLIRGPFLGPGVHAVYATHKGFWPMRYPVSQRDSEEPVSLELFSRATLELEVTTPAGRPIRGAELELTHVELAQSADAWLATGWIAAPGGLATDDAGRLVLEGVPRGTYRWTCREPGGSVASGEVRLAPRARLSLPIRIAPQ